MRKFTKYWKTLIFKGKARSPAGDTGAWGEGVAARFLEERARMRILVRNWRNPADRREEIDVVARDGAVLVFVEVRTRRAGALTGGYASLNARKRKALRRSCRAYLNQLPERPTTWRFDVVEVETRPGGEPEIRHYANVPLFS